MKRRFRLLFATLLIACITVSCSNETEIADQVAIGEPNNITITTEDFGADQNVTRTTGTRKTETIDLGEGLAAEVSVEPDRSQGQTRSTAISNGHYTIYALDNSGNRITGTHKLLKGTVSGGTFIKDAGSQLTLAPGTYTFVCFNDAVTDNGTQLSVSKANFGKALIGSVQTAISGRDYNISFTMKHVVGRVRVKLTAYVPIKATTTATISQKAGTAAEQLLFNIDGTLDHAHLGTLAADALSFPATSKERPQRKDFSVASISNEYQYYHDGQTAANLKINLTGGTLYRRALTGIASLPTTFQVARNGSYTVNIKLLPKYKYLFQDGTTGYLADKGTRTPIALVIKDNNGTPGSGLAIALNKANHGNTVKWYYQYSGSGSQQNNPSTVTYERDGITDMNGYNYTWNPAYSTDGKVRANEQTLYPAFYYAAHYGDELTAQGINITGANIGKWYLGSIGEWYTMINTITFCEEFDNNPFSYDGQRFMQHYAHTLWDIAFSRAGGSLTSDSFWTALECKSEPDYLGRIFYDYAWFMDIDDYYTYAYAFSKGSDTYSNKYSQAFVNF